MSKQRRPSDLRRFRLRNATLRPPAPRDPHANARVLGGLLFIAAPLAVALVAVAMVAMWALGYEGIGR